MERFPGVEVEQSESVEKDEREQLLFDYVARSPHATVFAKKALIWLIKMMRSLNVAVEMIVNDEELGRQISLSVHDMNGRGKWSACKTKFCFPVLPAQMSLERTV
ncbi:MAG: hypothetical protein CEN88_348 [Candidatus Berkelbacteria bacterium Licking1014_2]|uniref:Uncharacterized protein n=1 Tax=Candidatus Berkelbacteria bacterium Licking1014_2 TaxID=2017146 RepID=A0A554LV14_9BACT|nr:MAG: hypothetical protein CEN88_348 [Candidatus Berkelbacteria bacterium Licking1014_2]